MVALTYEPIATSTLSSSQSSVTFSSITQAYSDLIVIIQGSLVSGANTIYCQLNGDTSTAYQTNYMGASTSSTWAGQGSTRSEGVSFGNFGVGFTANQELLIQGTFNNYSGSNTKTCLAKYWQGNNSLEFDSSRWNGTVGITSLYFYTNGSNSFAAGTMFTLYGILRA